MTSRSKIIGINRDGPEAIEPETDANTSPITETNLESEGYPSSELAEIAAEDAAAEAYYEEYDDLESPRRDWKMPALAFGLGLIFAAWTGFFIWSQLLIFQTAPTNMDIISLIGAWALPCVLIGIIWLLALRHSNAESGRFADVGAQLRHESEALEARMRTVNEEISLAREFLAQNAQDLGSLGRQAADKLNVAAENLGAALAESDEKAKRLEEVSNAAASNLEQLRKHLPVVTSAAKDVSNQIGAAGNNAQNQVNGLIQTLETMNSSGQGAREAIQAMEQQALQSSENMSRSITDTAKAFSDDLTQANLAADEMAGRLKSLAKDSLVTVNKASRKLKARTADSVEQLQAKLAKLNTALDAATGKAEAGVAKASENMSTLLGDSGDKLTERLRVAENTMRDIQNGIDAQDARFNEMVAQLSQQIDRSRSEIEALDASATEKTSNLAFAIETLVQSTQDLDAQVSGSNSGARDLLEQAERLNVLLDKASDGMRSELPEALSSVEEKVNASFATLDASRTASNEIDEQSRSLLDRMTQIDTIIAAQREAVEKLFAASDEQVTNQHEQVAALSESLSKTEDLIDRLAKQSSGELVSSISNIRDTAEETVARSRTLIEEELGSVAGRLSAQNAELLDSAVESQLANISERMSGAITAQLALSQASADKLSAQLAQIEEMTANLEQRAADTQSGFGGIDQEGFARRMALLTESLNSTAIDVAKILSSEVTDTAWASYLKGDRGVFTRRAVKLLDSGEARAIAEHYDGDPEFAEHVNRYIHDFEAMMRVLLSTRDGNAVGVTVLSSDVGKLYVALAQAIERLRG